jgi:outer membrane autotransporter protein
MKKIIFVAALMAAVSAQAVELGINASRDNGNSNRDGGGLTISESFGTTGIVAGWDRYSSGTELNKYSLMGTYDVANFGKAVVAVKAGVAYVDQKNSTDGYAGLVGVGVSYPVAKKVSLTADYRYQAGQSRISSLDGGTVSAGLKYSF